MTHFWSGLSQAPAIELSQSLQVAEMLNGNPMGGKRRSAYHYDLWCLKYLPKFKWDHLTEEIGNCPELINASMSFHCSFITETLLISCYPKGEVTRQLACPMIFTIFSDPVVSLCSIPECCAGTEDGQWDFSSKKRARLLHVPRGPRKSWGSQGPAQKGGAPSLLLCGMLREGICILDCRIQGTSNSL